MVGMVKRPVLDWSSVLDPSTSSGARKLLPIPIIRSACLTQPNQVSDGALLADVPTMS